MDLKDIIHEGKVDRDGMKNIQYLIDENKELEESFAYIEITSPLNGVKWDYYYSKETAKKSIRLMPFIKEAIYDYIKNRRFVRTKSLIKILEEINIEHDPQ